MRKFILYVACVFMFFPLFFSCYSDLVDETDMEEWKDDIDDTLILDYTPFVLWVTINDANGNDLLDPAFPNAIDSTKTKMYTLNADGSWKLHKDTTYYTDPALKRELHFSPIFNRQHVVESDMGLDFYRLCIPGRMNPEKGSMSHTYRFQWDEERSDTVTFTFNYPYPDNYKYGVISNIYVNGKVAEELKYSCHVPLAH